MDGLVYISGKEEISPSSLANDIHEARFVNRQIKVFAVPCINTLLVEVYDSDLDAGTFESNDGTGRTT